MTPQFPNLVAALKVFEKFEVEHEKRYKAMTTQNDALHWFHVRDAEITKVQHALWEDTKAFNMKKHCELVGINRLRELASLEAK